MEYEHSAIICQNEVNNSDHIRRCWIEHISQLNRPFVLLKPKMFPDGDKWCALYGGDLQEGVAGFGDTPEQAAVQFDIEWLNRTTHNGSDYVHKSEVEAVRKEVEALKVSVQLADKLCESTAKELTELREDKKRFDDAARLIGNIDLPARMHR